MHNTNQVSSKNQLCLSGTKSGSFSYRPSIMATFGCQAYGSAINKSSQFQRTNLTIILDPFPEPVI